MLALLQLRCIGLDLDRLHNGASGLPYHYNVVFGGCRDLPRVLRAPRQVRRPAGVAAMHEQELGRAVLGVLRRLLFADAAQVPYVDAAVSGGRAQNGLMVRRPGQLQHFIFVGLERVQVHAQVTKVPQADGLVARGCGNNVLTRWTESNSVDLALVRLDAVLGRLTRVTRIPEQHLAVVAHGRK